MMRSIGYKRDEIKKIKKNKNTYIHTYIHSLIPPREDQCEWHRMTRMTGPDCVVMCNLINTYIHTYIHTYTHTQVRIVQVERVCPSVTPDQRFS